MASFNFISAFSHFLCAVLAELYSWSVAISVYIIGLMGFFLGSPYSSRSSQWSSATMPSGYCMATNKCDESRMSLDAHSAFVVTV